MNNTIICLLITISWSAGIAGTVSLYWISRFRKELDLKLNGIFMEIHKESQKVLNITREIMNRKDIIKQLEDMEVEE